MHFQVGNDITPHNQTYQIMWSKNSASQALQNAPRTSQFGKEMTELQLKHSLLAGYYRIALFGPDFAIQLHFQVHSVSMMGLIDKNFVFAPN